MRRIICGFVAIFLFTEAYAEEGASEKSLYESHCSACHSLTPPPKAAPPFRGIIRKYYEQYDEREKFVDAIRTFVLEPDEGKVVCAPAKEQFGIMPKLPFDEEQVGKIAAWMWDDKSLWPPRYR